MLPCHLCQRHTRAAIKHDLLAVDVEPSTPNLATFEPCSAHTRSDALDDDAPLQFRHGRYDDDYGSAERTLGVNCLTLREELNTEPRKFIQRLEQVLGAPRQTVARPDQEHVKSMAAGVLHHPVEFGSSRSCSAESVIRIFPDDLEPALGSERPKLV